MSTRVGRFGFIFDRRFGQVQTYEDGTPVREGDHVRHMQAPGGILAPSATEGTAEFPRWDDGGELSVMDAKGHYFHMNGIVRRVLA